MNTPNFPSVNAMDPFQILAKVVPRARSEEELVELAAQMGPPPPADYQPGSPSVPRGGVAPMKGMPQSPLLPGGNKPMMVPPMTRGEAQTKPNIGQLLLG